MLKSFNLKIEDKESADYGKSFIVKQAPVLEAEKLLIKFGSCFSNNGVNEEKTNELMDDILKYCYYFDEKEGTEIQLINERANLYIEDLSTLITLKTEFIKNNKGFIKVVQSLPNLIKNFTTINK